MGNVLAGKYRLERRLGSGGFASVWAARHLMIDRSVALKVLSDPVLRVPGVVDRFVREAKLAAMELHPTIVRVEDMGTTDNGVPFLVMELLRGESLDKVLRRERALPLSICLAIVRPLLEGLAVAHNRGIIHRDIKPGNIFIVAPGSTGPPVRILDLGIAKNLDDPEKITHTGQLVGTPKYLAPEVMFEQVNNNWRPAVDVFSLGMVLFKMLTGKLPFDEDQRFPEAVQLVRQMEFYEKLAESSGDVPGPSTVCPNLPASIDRFIRRSTSMTWTRRFGDAKEMLLAYDEAVARAGCTVDSATVASLVTDDASGGVVLEEAPTALRGDSGQVEILVTSKDTNKSSPPSTLTPTEPLGDFVLRAPSERASSFELALIVEDGLCSEATSDQDRTATLRMQAQSDSESRPIEDQHHSPHHSPPPPTFSPAPPPPEVSPTPLPPLPDVSPAPSLDDFDVGATIKMERPPHGILNAAETLKLDRLPVFPNLSGKDDASLRAKGTSRILVALVIVVFVAAGLFLLWQVGD